MFLETLLEFYYGEHLCSVFISDKHELLHSCFITIRFSVIIVMNYFETESIPDLSLRAGSCGLWTHAHHSVSTLFFIKMVQIHLVLFLAQPRNQPFSKGALVPLGENGT